jgi:hypothetical protein
MIRKVRKQDGQITLITAAEAMADLESFLLAGDVLGNGEWLYQREEEAESKCPHCGDDPNPHDEIGVPQCCDRAQRLAMGV